MRSNDRIVPTAALGGSAGMRKQPLPIYPGLFLLAGQPIRTAAPERNVA
ncbi:hypothetical protein C7476_108185 [Phyllobacterium bourgognense]|uniref:Uncharacterized protein n=1 Tax=Phyllobacterium bourgognense TaxID=314236 RepID=A0A368YQ70_9HYPH|nr:hypothetical protein C7476_108185 [Phyllobacterium bourgognense]